MRKPADVRKVIVALALGCMLAGASSAWAQPTPPSPRLALVADPDCANLAALVTTELSGDAGLHLLERDELAKAGDEAGLQRLARQDTVNLGKLVGADGLLFLHKADADVWVRLTAVGLGDALYDGRAVSGNDPAVAARTIARLVSGYAPKLRLVPAAVVPISVLNLRAEYATAQAATLERRLTLLLESRLAAVPEYVVLERRYAGALGFERSLDPAVRPLLQGSYLVDGTLSLPLGGTGELTVHLRLASYRGGPRSREIRGDTTDLPALAEKLSAAIRREAGHGSDPGAWQPEKEAREHLQEAVWGWQHNASDLALEALDSAELLGEKASDLHAIRINLLLTRAGKNLTSNNGVITGKRPAAPPSMDPRLDDWLGAVREISAYADGNGEERLQLFQAREHPDLRAWDMRKDSIVLGAEMLSVLDESGAPRADELRLVLRTLTGYDPLHGKLGTGNPAHSWLPQDVYTNELPLSLEEALAYLDGLCTRPDQFIPILLVHAQDEGFCQRFLKTPTQQADAFARFLADLKTKPEGRLSYLTILSGSHDAAAADAACRDYVAELWSRRERLVNDKTAGPAWANLRAMPQDVVRRNAGEMVPLLRYYLTHLQESEHWMYNLSPMWQPEAWSERDAAAVWADYVGFRERMTAVWKARDYNAESLSVHFGELENPFAKKFPAIAAAGKPAAATPLVVTRFWHPTLLPGAPSFPFWIDDSAATEDGLCVVGFFRGKSGVRSLYHVTEPEAATEIVEVPDADRTGALMVMSDFVDVLRTRKGKAGVAWVSDVIRYERRAKTWHPLDLPETTAGRSVVNGEFYLKLRDPAVNDLSGDSLVRYDLATGRMTLLAGSRRKPAQNQFEDRRETGFGNVFAGPGGRPCAAGEGIFYVREQPGTWPAVLDLDGAVSPRQEGDKRLVYNHDGEVALIDPARAEPIYLMTPTQPHYRSGGSAKPRVPSLPPWANLTLWDAPEDGDLLQGSGRGSLCWHGGKLFILRVPVGNRKGFELLVYTPDGGRKPWRIPLDFHLDGTAHERLKTSYCREAGSDWTADQVAHPGETFFEPHLAASSHGLYLVTQAGGVWFVLDAELNDYLERHHAERL